MNKQTCWSLCGIWSVCVGVAGICSYFAVDPSHANPVDVIRSTGITLILLACGFIVAHAVAVCLESRNHP